MIRSSPYRSKLPDIVKERIQETIDERMYLLQTIGPTSYVVKEQNLETKFKVNLGLNQFCSCEDKEICKHILFIMLKVLRIPSTNSIIWQKSLIDSEINQILRGDFCKKIKEKKGNQEEIKEETKEEIVKEQSIVRHNLTIGDVCAICQEEMYEEHPLTYCRKGCGNNFHIECMKIYAENRKQNKKEFFLCPLCRVDWGETILKDLRKEMNSFTKTSSFSHKKTTCQKCKQNPIYGKRFHCILCSDYDLCERCFKSGTHKRHPFVVKLSNLASWIPVISQEDQLNSTREQIQKENNENQISTCNSDLSKTLSLAEYLSKFLPGITSSTSSTSSSTSSSISSSLSVSLSNSLCTLCQKKVNNKISILTCEHFFHENCLQNYLLVDKLYFCPQKNCRKRLFPGISVEEEENKEEKVYGKKKSKIKSQNTDFHNQAQEMFIDGSSLSKTVFPQKEKNSERLISSSSNSHRKSSVIILSNTRSSSAGNLQTRGKREKEQLNDKNFLPSQLSNFNISTNSNRQESAKVLRENRLTQVQKERKSKREYREKEVQNRRNQIDKQENLLAVVEGLKSSQILPFHKLPPIKH